MSIEKLNPEIKQKWIDNLLSGEYRQGIETLHINKNCMCCLGVLAITCGVPLKQLKNCDFLLPSHNNFIENKEHQIPKSLLFGGKIGETLANMNDELHKSFEEIAEYIKNNEEI